MFKSHNSLNIKGKKFGRLFVKHFHHNSGKPKYISFWVCKCSCGQLPILSTSQLRSGNTKSCGCLFKESLIIRNTKHSLSYSRFYRIWNGIIRRTSYKKGKDYKFYGARGIKNLWKNFIEFKNDMYSSYLLHVKKYGEKETTIDRIDFNSNYCKENCRWSTWGEQRKNKRNKNRA